MKSSCEYGNGHISRFDVLGSVMSMDKNEKIL